MNNSKNMNRYLEEDYFSDDNKDQNNDHNEENEELIEEFEEDEEEMDPETRRILWEATMRTSCNYDFSSSARDTNKTKKKDKSNKKQNKKTTSLSLEEFNKKIDEESKAKQPKKFTSKRVEEKKKITGNTEDRFVKRSFNARLPPYNWTHKSREETFQIDINNKNDFPSL